MKQTVEMHYEVVFSYFVRLWKYALPFRFLIIGGWNFLFSYVFFAGLFWFLRETVNEFIIISISTVVGITHSFICHRFFTYRSKGSWVKEYFRFYVVYSGQMTLNILLFGLLVRYMQFNPYITQACISITLIIFSYYGHKYFSFK